MKRIAAGANARNCRRLANCFYSNRILIKTKSGNEVLAPTIKVAQRNLLCKKLMKVLMRRHNGKNSFGWFSYSIKQIVVI